MRYSTLGTTGLSVSALGFGCMRLPMREGKVDRDRSTPLLRRAVDLGVNFFDTAIGYCGSDSQRAVGEALEPLRSTILLSTKNHNHSAPTSEWRRYLEDSLRLLRTDHIDIYNHHGINWDVFTAHLDPAKGGHTKEALKAKEEGLIRHVGFSFHGPAADLVKLADTGYYESVILQYNLLDQGNADAMHHAKERGMGVIVMGPVGGGRLGLPSEHIRELTGGAAETTPEAALRFVWAHSAVNIALSGMENLDMLEQNVRIAKNTTPFTAQQIEALNGMIAERKRKSGLYCTGCRYCMPACAAGVSIPEQLDLLNMARIYGLVETAKQRYGSTWSVNVKATECIECRACVPKCPQNIDIPARLREVVTMFDPHAGGASVETSVEKLEATGAFTMRLKARSLADRDLDISVGLRPETGMSFDADTVSFGTVKAFGRSAKSLSGRLDPRAGSGRYALTVSYAGRNEEIDKTYAFALLRKGLRDGWDGDGWVNVPAPAEAFSRDRETAGLHGMRFRLSYDDDGLLVLIDVRDDFLFPSRSDKHKGALVDCVEMFLDGRPGGRIGRRAYEENVNQVTLYPGTPGTHGAFHNARTEIKLDLSSERTPAGYRLRARVPFSSFCAKPGIPSRVGFDLAVNSANAAGERIAQYVWAGNSDNWQSASNFREVWLA